MDDWFKGDLVRLAVIEPQRDAAYLCRWNRDSEYARLLASDPPHFWTEKATREWLEKHMEELYLFAIHTLEDDRMIGLLDFSTVDSVSGNAWVAIGIGEREYWGKGYGADAMRIGLRFGFCQLNLHRINLSVFEYNTRAYRMYRKLGFKEEGRARQWLNRGGRRWDMIYMGLLRQEWQELSNELPTCKEL